MARSQMLYVGTQGAVRYSAPGNVRINSGDSGTVALWYHPAYSGQRGNVVTVETDGEDSLSLARSQDLWKLRTWSGGSTVVLSTSSPSVAWRFVVATWDFTGDPDAGTMRLYLDGEEVGDSPITNALVPADVPSEICIGPGTDNTYDMAHAVFDKLAIWDEEITAAEVSALYEAGRDHVPEDADGSGTLLFRADWDGQFDADMAQGSAVATLEGEADQYCRLDVASRHDGKRFSYRIGMPSHDGSEDDRVPAFAILPPTADGQTIATNGSEYGRLDVLASGEALPVGASLAPWLPAPISPATLRVGVQLEAATMSDEERISVGAQDYICGKRKPFSAGAGCTTSTIYSDQLDEPDGYWTGAELHVLGGELRGQKVRVAGNSQVDRSLTIEGQFGQAPSDGVAMMVIEPARVEAPGDDGDQFRLECDLTESHDGIERFAVLETAVIHYNGYTRFNHGRIQVYPDELSRDRIHFGKRVGSQAEWESTILIDRVELDGPGRYDVTTNTDDDFLVSDPASGESIKVWRTDGMQRELRQPEQHPDPTAAYDAMRLAGSWRDTIKICPRWMRYDARNDRLVALLVGIDPDGIERAGYIHGTWDESAGMVKWEDDPDPRNPFLVLDDLRAVLGGRSSIYGRLASITGVFEIEEGNWALAFTAGIGLPDSFLSCAMTGAPDPYSFDPEEHFDPDSNPLSLTMAGNDKLVPEGSGIGLVGNRDCEVFFVENPWADRKGDRFWGYGRAKTVKHHGEEVFDQYGRPLACMATGDFRNARHVPWRNQVITPAFGWFHWPHPKWFHPSTVGLVVDDGGVTKSHVGLWVSEDGVHLQRLMNVVNRETPPYNSSYLKPVSNPVRLGNRRLYWYSSTKIQDNHNFASIRVDGEALYRLEDTAAEGELETSSLQREGDHWQDLRLNVDPKDGGLTVAVLDGETGSVVPGFGHDDCDPIGDVLEKRVTWNGVGLPEVPHDLIRLEFRVVRSSVADASPEVYAWSIARPLDTDRPAASAVMTEGRANPTGIADPTPEFSWTFEDRAERTQTAYHVLVASTQEKLDANEGDLWDSGVVLSSEPKAKYAGSELGSESVYFWKVRVRNSEGVWSEEW